MAVSLRASTKGLEIVNKARKRKGWTKTMTVAWWQTALTSQATLRRFWRKQPIQQDTFIKICEAVGLSNWQEIVDGSEVDDLETREMPLQNWGEAPDVSAFYGRTEELAKLERWIVTDGCRLVALLGMGGIGKTALAAMLADGIQDKFNYLYWRSLRPAPPIEDILAELLQFLSHQYPANPSLPRDEGRVLPEGVNARVSQLIDCLRKHRCLLILDDFDTVLQSGDPTGSYLEGYEGYSELTRRVGEVSNKSCLVLISREKPREVASREGRSLPVRSLKLTGLQSAEAREILREKDLSEADNWDRLITLYRGHPLALQIVSTIIQELFNGRVSEFLKQQTIVLGDLSDLLNQQFKRLSNLEKEIMYWLAINRQPIFLSQLQADLGLTVATSTLMEVLSSLGWRSLIEKSTENSEILFTLQPVVMKYVTNQFVTQVCAEICTRNIELLKSHALVKHQGQYGANEFLIRPILTLVKERLMKVFGNESRMAESLNEILSMLQGKTLTEIGYASDNILNLLAN